MILFRSAAILMMLVFLLGCHNTKKSTPIAIGANKNDFTQVQTKYAEILKVTPKEIDNLPLYHFIDQWIGVKYKYGGTTTEGVDCSGFANILYKEVYKKVMPRSSQDIAKELKTISKTNLSEGDILIFDIENKKIHTLESI